MGKLFKEYGDEIYDTVEAQAKDAARKATSELRRESPGDYAKKWRHKAQKNGKTQYAETVYNTNYRLPHLLEKPHAVGPKKRGQYPAHRGSSTDHTGIIARVEEKYTRKFFNELVIKL